MTQPKPQLTDAKMIEDRAVPCGIFSVVFDNSPISLEGRRFSRRQIQYGLKKGILRPGMRFRHSRHRHIDFVLTRDGLAWPQPRRTAR